MAIDTLLDSTSAFWDTLAMLVTQRRTHLGMNRAELAKRADIGERTLQDLERRRRDTFTDVVVVKILGALDLPASVLEQVAELSTHTDEVRDVAVDELATQTRTPASPRPLEGAGYGFVDVTTFVQWFFPEAEHEQVERLRSFVSERGGVIIGDGSRA